MAAMELVLCGDSSKKLGRTSGFLPGPASLPTFTKTDPELAEKWKLPDLPGQSNQPEVTGMASRVSAHLTAELKLFVKHSLKLQTKTKETSTHIKRTALIVQKCLLSKNHISDKAPGTRHTWSRLRGSSQLSGEIDKEQAKKRQLQT